MSGFILVGENPFRCIDPDTGAGIPVYKYKDPATSENVFYLILNKQIRLVHLPAKLAEQTTWQTAFGVMLDKVVFVSNVLTNTKIQEVKDKSIQVSIGMP